MGRSWIVENKWTCYSCGSKNLGRDMRCSTCGSPKEKGEKYNPGGSTPVTDPELLKQASAGPNWTCRFCFNDNRALLTSCRVCGASRDPSEPPPAPKKRSKATIIPPPRAASTAPSPAPSLRESPRYAVLIEEKSLFSTLRKNVGLILLCLAVLSSFVILWVLLSTHEVRAEVRSTSWEYRKILEQRMTKSGSGWGTPSGSFNASCHTRQRGTERCHPRDCNPHQVSYDCRPHDCSCHVSCTDLSNGYSRCEEHCSTCYDTCTRTEYNTCYDECPVYDEWCTYSYYEWDEIDREVTRGTNDEPHWGSRISPNESVPQRVIKSESYSVIFYADEEEWTYHPSSLREYSSFSTQDSWLIEVNYAGMVWPRRPQQENR